MGRGAAGVEPGVVDGGKDGADCNHPGGGLLPLGSPGVGETLGNEVGGIWALGVLPGGKGGLSRPGAPDGKLGGAIGGVPAETPGKLGGPSPLAVSTDDASNTSPRFSIKPSCGSSSAIAETLPRRGLSWVAPILGGKGAASSVGLKSRAGGASPIRSSLARTTAGGVSSDALLHSGLSSMGIGCGASAGGLLMTAVP